jgi:hypothetical protein
MTPFLPPSINLPSKRGRRQERGAEAGAGPTAGAAVGGGLEGYAAVYL